MEVIHEKLDKDIFIDVVLNKKELKDIASGEMPSVTFYIGATPVNLGVRLPIEEDVVPKKKKAKRG